MLAPAVTAIKARMAAGFTDWPVRWPNERFPDPVDKGGYPVDAEGAPRPFVEAEVIGGENRLTGIGEPGRRLWIHPGLIRAYVAVPSGTGSDAAETAADAIAALFERQEFRPPPLWFLVAGRWDEDGFWQDDVPWPGGPAERLVRCHDASVFAGVAGYEDGNYFVLMVSVRFDFFYQA